MPLAMTTSQVKRVAKLRKSRESRAKQREEASQSQAAANEYLPQFENDPVGYANYIGAHLTPKQIEVLKAVIEPPYKVLVPSGHSTGKSWLGSFLTNWWYDTRPQSVTITTAPTHRDICDVLWSEVRMQRKRFRPSMPNRFIGPTAPEMRSSVDHYAKGFTAKKGESFVGRHPDKLLLIFDEAVGIDQIFWTTANSMFKPNGKHAWVCFFNPTNTSSQAYHEAQRGGWRVIPVSSLDHPNIADELAGGNARIPGAVDLAQVRAWLLDWFDPIPAADADPARDIEFPPSSGQWHRPGPLGESRVLGRWPTQAVNSVWSQGLWQMVCAARFDVEAVWPVVIGADIAYYGDDRSVFTVRKGKCILHMESHNGWDTVQSARRLRELCHIHAGDGSREQQHLTPQRIPVQIDSGAMGPGVIDNHEGYNFIGIGSSCRSTNDTQYPNIRSQLWFDAAMIAKQGLLDVSRLPQHVRDELGRELMAPTYSVDSLGRRVVEEKAQTKKRLRRSPDLGDSFNLSLLQGAGTYERVAGHVR